MSRNAEAKIEIGGHVYYCRLALGQIEELQERTGVGPLVLFNRIADGSWKISDLRETIWCGIVGGGRPRPEADRAVNAIADYPLIESVTAAADILTAALFGVDQEEWPGKAPVEKTQAEEIHADSSFSPPSTLPAL